MTTDDRYECRDCGKRYPIPPAPAGSLVSEITMVLNVTTADGELLERIEVPVRADRLNPLGLGAERASILADLEEAARIILARQRLAIYRVGLNGAGRTVKLIRASDGRYTLHEGEGISGPWPFRRAANMALDAVPAENRGQDAVLLIGLLETAS